MDMAGNVAEWTEDEYDTYDPSGSANGTANGAVEPRQPVLYNLIRTVRGGGYKNDAKDTRVAVRVGVAPSAAPTDATRMRGLRCCRKYQ